MLIGLAEIAKESGVSRSTVSRVINNDPRVSPQTRLRVQEVIRRLNYQPNPMARSLAGGHSRIIGLVIPMGMGRLFTDPYIPQLIQGVSTACSASGYLVMLWAAEPEEERRTMQQILQNPMLDGVIISSMLMDDPLLEALPDSQIPFVAIGRHPGNPNIHFVDVDNIRSSREMVDFMLRQGSRRPGTICGPLRMIAGVDRLQGFREALEQWDLPVLPELIVEGSFTEESGYVGMQKLLPQHPDAVFAASDAMAVGALRAINEAGLQVPGDIALTGYDDMPFAASLNPPLTTVRQPILKVGAAAVETLIDVIERDGDNLHQVILPTELIIRESCKAIE